MIYKFTKKERERERKEGRKGGREGGREGNMTLKIGANGRKLRPRP